MEQQYADQIFEYLHDMMDPTTRESFEKKIKGDPLLAGNVKEQQEMLEDIHATLKYKDVLDDPLYEEANKFTREYLKKKGIKQINTTPPPSVQASERKHKKSYILIRILGNAALIAALFVVSRTWNTRHVRSLLKGNTSRLKGLWKSFRS